MAEDVKFKVTSTSTSLGSIQAENAQAEIAAASEPIATAEVPQVVAQVTETAAPDTTAAPNVVTDTPAAEEFKGEWTIGEPEVVAPVTEQKANWQDLVKDAPKEKLAELLGLDEFDLKFAEYRKNGGDPYKYLEAKSFDWNKVPDSDVVLRELQEQYPNLSAEEVSELFADKYKQGDLYTEDEIRRGAIQMKADAYKARQSKIEAQKNFVIPERANVQQPVIDEAKVAAERAKVFVSEHEFTKGLFQSKSVTIDAGDGLKINAPIENPQLLLDIISDNKTFSKYTSDAQGVPDMQKLYQIALFTANPQQYQKNLINYGKTLATKAMVEDGQNAQRPIGKPPVAEVTTLKDAWKNARSSTIGG
jgi:hypothetical protein